MTFRTDAGLREQLEAAAAARGITASEEVTRRLHASFRDDDMRAAIREEIRAALAETTERQVGGFPLVPYNERSSQFIAVRDDGTALAPQNLAERGARLCVPQIYGHGYDPVAVSGEDPRALSGLEANLRAGYANKQPD